jgi:hypothetical protein
MKTSQNLPVNEWNHQLPALVPVLASGVYWQRPALALGTKEIQAEAASNNGINQENGNPSFVFQPDV